MYKEQKKKIRSWNLFNMKGFTLIELLVVISIIGIVAGISAFGFQGAREGARDARRKSDLEAIRSGLEMYRADCNQYPPSLPSAGGQLTGSSCSPANSNVYIQEVPDDPSVGRDYFYTQVGKGYELCAALEDTTASDTCSGGCGGATCNYKVTNP
jgi:type II secretion system protein G